MLRKTVLIGVAFSATLMAIESAADDTQNRSIIEFDLTKGAPSVDVEIAGTTYNFLVDPSLKKSRFLVNPSIAKELGLENSGIFSIQADVDGEIFDVKSDKVKIKVNQGKEKKRKIYWIERDYWDSFDGVISASRLGYDKVSFFIPEMNGKKYTKRPFETISENDWRIPITFHDDLPREVTVSFKPHLESSRANLVLSQTLRHHKLITLDDTKVHDFRREFGVQAQVAKTTFINPANIFGIKTPTIDIQINTSALEVGSKEYDEVIVKGTQKKSSKFKPALLLTKDFLGECVRIEFSKDSNIANIYCEDAP